MTGITWEGKPYTIRRKDTSNIEILVNTVDENDGSPRIVTLTLSDHEARILAHDIRVEAK